MPRRSCDGAGLLEAFRAAVANLEDHVDEVNGLNVYPVPDGDTGSNMAATVRAALTEAESVGDAPADRIAQAISFGALMGARGNSGVITSQVFRGMAEGLVGKKRFNGLDLAHALSQGTTAAYSAVAKPVEGTILTVIREMSTAAVATAEKTNDIDRVLAATVEAGRKAVAKTPSLLSILREAGVVDAGGQGLYRLFEGALLRVQGKGPTVERPAASAAAASASALVAHADEGFGYETMFLVQAEPAKRLNPDDIRAHLESIGESVLVAGDARAIKIHVHSERPDQVLAYGLTLGSLSRISVENLDIQTRDVREQRAAEFTEDGSDPMDEVPPTDAPAQEDPSAAARGADDRDGVGPAVVAVVAGDGLAAVFEEFGVQQILRGGQSENPSTGELLRVARMARQREVLVLPNNPNVRLAAEQAARMCEDKRLVVVPTRNAAEGLAALLALDPTKDAATNAGPMTEASRAVQTMQVTEAVRDARMGRKKVRKGQIIVLDPDDGLVASGSRVEPTVLDAVGHLEPGFELVTIYYGAEATLDEAEALARKVGEATNGAEVEVVHGGQPHYRYLIAAE
jgi:DAK2 domain fusion protein YloV